MNYGEHLENVFSICENKSVLEIGAFRGYISQFIEKSNPHTFYVIEPNPYAAKEGVFVGTANDYYKDECPTVDIVILMGVLYHLHSPLHLLEQIINKSKPKTIIIENTISRFEMGFNKELYNVAGNAFSDKDIDTPLEWHITLPQHYYNDVMNEAGYKTDYIISNYDHLYIDEDHKTEKTKKTCWLGVYTR